MNQLSTMDKPLLRRRSESLLAAYQRSAYRRAGGAMALLQCTLWLVAVGTALAAGPASGSPHTGRLPWLATLVLLATAAIVVSVLDAERRRRYLQRRARRQAVRETRRRRARMTLQEHIDQLQAANEQLTEKNAQIKLRGQEVFRLFRVASEQAQLLAAARDRAEAASRGKSELLANMSHELRTPMTAILGFSEMLIDDPAGTKQREIAVTIHRNGQYLLRLINGLLDLSQIENGKLQLERGACRPKEIVDEVTKLLQGRARAKGLLLAHACEGDIPDLIETDPTRLRQILINLVGNAIKFTEAGSVRVVTRMRLPDPPSPAIEFHVIDTGIGIPQDEQARLFQPFTQLDGSTARSFGGSGLGLAISKRLATMLGGDITINSEQGIGSTFVLSLPVASSGAATTGDARNQPAGAADAPPASRGPRRFDRPWRILLAEDGPDNQRLLCCLLETAGAEVVAVANGQLAVDRALAAAAEERPFDVILMDMQMPVVDGYTATERLRQSGYAGPVVALTAYAMKGDRDRCLQVGCNDYVAKPVCRNVLLDVVERWSAAGKAAGHGRKRCSASAAGEN